MERSTDSNDKLSIGPATFIQLGFVIGGLTVFGWAIWWASGVQSDLNTIKSTMIRFSALDSLDARVKLLETVGSPALRDVQKQVDELRRELELHRATTTNSKDNK